MIVETITNFRVEIPYGETVHIVTPTGKVTIFSSVLAGTYVADNYPIPLYELTNIDSLCRDYLGDFSFISGPEYGWYNIFRPQLRFPAVRYKSLHPQRSLKPQGRCDRIHQLRWKRRRYVQSLRTSFTKNRL